MSRRMSFLIQAAIPGAPSGVMEIAVGFALAILIALSGWQTVTLRHVEGDLDKLKQLIIGYDGKNGIRSTVEALDDEMDIVRRRHEVEDEMRRRDLVVTPAYVGPERRVEHRRQTDSPPTFDEGRES